MGKFVFSLFLALSFLLTFVIWGRLARNKDMLLFQKAGWGIFAAIPFLGPFFYFWLAALPGKTDPSNWIPYRPFMRGVGFFGRHWGSNSPYRETPKTVLAEGASIAILKAADLRSEGRKQEALDMLLRSHIHHTNDPELNYQVAWTYDSMGEESKAVSFYEAALANGLKTDRRSAYLGLGSTYRCLGEYATSAAIFDKACAEFPEDRALMTFRALTLYNLGHAAQGMDILLTQLLDTTDNDEIKSYDKALRFYKDKLDQTWT